MTHWAYENAAGDADDEPLVRPYTITRGRTSAGRDDLTLITVITAVGDGALPEPAASRGLQPEHRTVLGLCRVPVAVAEIAAGLDLPVSVTKILLGDLIGAGLARARPPATFMTEDGAPDMALLQAVRDGLRKL
ncbi:DUF742 domain-containing protein [Streptomyces sp. NBC_01262]|uniref:DUF742 domain-containing protein n=1 Tax=Streptomyces sp. NBC_01262 TaxID=2903803 RepID=UPI002E368157|nr:DUF742 domain-containing protein [Streptomyces sp. NBC_01262]